MTKRLGFICMILVAVVLTGLLAASCSTTTTLTSTTTAPPSTQTTTSTTTQTTTTTTTSTTTTTTTSTPPPNVIVIPGVEPIELSLVSFLPDVPPGANWHRLFIKLVNEISGGAMTIRFVGGPEAIPMPDQPSAVQRGTVDIASILSSFGDALVPGSSTCGRAEYSPMELRDPESPSHPAYQYWEDAYAKVGIYYFGASVSSYPQVQTVLYLGKDISSLNDLKGLKIASVGGSNSAFINSLGATTVPIDFPDYFTAMERGTVDGYNIGIPGIEDFSLTPVTKAMLDEPFSSNGGMWLMNLDKYNSLTQKQKDVINAAAIEAEIEGADLFTQTVIQVKGDISAAGVDILHLPPADSVAFYLAYRNNMWAADIARWPDIGPQLKQWLVDPNFPRAQEPTG
jgi:TRAP-type C4-dicarboxylate transport system substrate-binding protein